MNNLRFSRKASIINLLYLIPYWKLLAIHDQKSENVCWAYSISTMLRASIRCAVKKYNIKDGLKKLENPNHHKMMRNELTMNVFPFGDDGADPSIILKLV